VRLYVYIVCVYSSLLLISFNFISFHFIPLHSIPFRFIPFHFISFHFNWDFIPFHCIALLCIALHCIALHFILFHFISFHFIHFIHSSRTFRHHALNDLVARAFASAAIPVANEPQGFSRADGKRPDGLILYVRTSLHCFLRCIAVSCELVETSSYSLF